MKKILIGIVVVILLVAVIATLGRKNVTVTGFEGAAYKVPVPLLAVRKPGKEIRYTVFFPDFRYYGKFPKYGWYEIDQMGSLHIFSNGQVKLHVLLSYRERFVGELSITPVVISMQSDVA